MPRQEQNKKIIVGLTGSFGSGKSSVARIFASYGSKVIDADRIAHRCIGRGTKAYKKIILYFGPEVLGKNREVNRRKLGKIVFDNKKSLGKLNGFIHPEVIRIIKTKLGRIKKGLVILDAPLLLEAGLREAADKLIVVTIDRETQIRRLLKKTSLKKADILKRIRSQIPLAAKVRLADFTIDNSSTLEKTRKQVTQIRRKLWKS